MKTTHKFLLSAMAALTMIAPCDAMLRTVAREIVTGLTTASAPRFFVSHGPMALPTTIPIMPCVDTELYTESTLDDIAYSTDAELALSTVDLETTYASDEEDKRPNDYIKTVNLFRNACAIPLIQILTQPFKTHKDYLKAEKTYHVLFLAYSTLYFAIINDMNPSIALEDLGLSRYYATLEDAADFLRTQLDICRSNINNYEHRKEVRDKIGKNVICDTILVAIVAAIYGSAKAVKKIINWFKKANTEKS